MKELFIECLKKYIQAMELLIEAHGEWGFEQSLEKAKLDLYKLENEVQK